MLQNASFLRKSAPDLLTSLINMSLVLRRPRDMHLSRSSSNVPRLPTLLKLQQNPHVLLTFGKVQNPFRAASSFLWVFLFSSLLWSSFIFLLSSFFFHLSSFFFLLSSFFFLLSSFFFLLSSSSFFFLLSSFFFLLSSFFFSFFLFFFLLSSFFFLSFSCLLSSFFFLSFFFHPSSFIFHLFSSLLFSSLTIPTSACPSLHIVGSLTSKFPSAMVYYIATGPTNQ